MHFVGVICKKNSVYWESKAFFLKAFSIGWFISETKNIFDCSAAEAVFGQNKETALVIYLACLAKVANLYYIILTAFKKHWPDTVAKFISGTQETFI